MDAAPPRTGLGQTLDLLFYRWRVRARWLAPPLKSVFQDAVCMDVSLLLSADIDECADGFVECDSKSTCVNLPGWYHCECRDGYHDNGLFSTNGESCVGEWPPRIIMNTYNLFLKNWNPNSNSLLPLCHCSLWCHRGPWYSPRSVKTTTVRCWFRSLMPLCVRSPSKLLQCRTKQRFSFFCRLL